MSTRVLIEQGSKRVFASALDWPGWSRSGKTESAALEALLGYRTRYAAVLKAASIPFKITAKTEVVERVPGDASTDFGAPGAVAALDAAPVSATQQRKLVALLEACWAAFDEACASVDGASLAMGPRGGGRQIEAMVAHVLEAEASYMRRIAARPPKFDPSDPDAAPLERAAVVAAIGSAVGHGLPAVGPRGGVMWPVRYFIRRAAWHVLDHTWEIEDRIP